MSEKDKKAQEAAEDFKNSKKVAADSPQKIVEKNLAEQSAENKSKGKKNERLSLTKVEEVEFIKDGRYIKAGTVKKVSQKAALIYRQKGLIK